MTAFRLRRPSILALVGLVLVGLAGTRGTGLAGPTATERIFVTSAAGEKMALHENVEFTTREASGVVLRIDPSREKQVIEGIGSSFTESSAFVLAHLEPEKRHEVMRRIFGREGANFALARTHIGSCDFSVEGKYSYAPVEGDTTLDHFDIGPDVEGFDPSVYAGIRDPEYDLLPMIREALAIRRAAGDSLRIVASAWTAPPWMKDIDDWYVPGSSENGWQGTGGSLRPEFVPTYAEYLVRYLEAYRAAGVPIWGLTPVNEPNGNGGHWESMGFTPESQNVFVNEHLGPLLAERGLDSTKVLVYDQNRDHMEEWADVILADPRSAEYVHGIAVHWYESTEKVYEDVFDRVHAKYPEFAIVHTEGCIDNLGNAAPGGIGDPAGFQEENWFDNDAFWWSRTATDWAYTATWAGPAVVDHPMYVPVHRYARNIIVSIDHWLTGWIDWNIVLDRRGGPNHVGNFCGAPIMIDTATGQVYYTPIFTVLEQFSRTIRPGDRAVATRLDRAGLDADAIHACATIDGNGLLSIQLLNTSAEPITLSLSIEGSVAQLEVPANALQTVQVRL